ncbi:MAG: fatty acid desaturase family protein [Myxococcota bacterium]
MRSGPELVRASAPFAQEDRALTWRLLAISLLVWAGVTAVAALAPWWPARLAAAVLAGLVTVRLFIFYHDYLHGAILQKSALGKAIMHAVGYWVMSGPSVWRQTHDYHHKHTAKMVGASIGSYPVVTVDIWKLMTPAQRRDYTLVRHPLNMLFGYFTVFMLGMCISAFRRNPAQHRDGLIGLGVHLGTAALVAALAGWQVALFTVVIPIFVACAAGSYLFYAQHNFPGMQIRDRADWEYTFAATRSSSMFDMGPVMHWLTGNIGYHHVHHLNHRIPFYRLPEAMAAMPELQDPGRTTWHPRDVLACLRLKLWDPAKGRMVTFEEADAAPPMDGLLTAK